MPRVLQILIAAVVLVSAGTARAEDAFFRVNVRALELTEGELPDWDPGDVPWRPRAQLREALQPYAILDADGEIYVSAEPFRSGRFRARNRPNAQPDHLTVCTAAGKDVSGRLFWPKSDLTGMVSVRFKIPASHADADNREDFHQAKLRHYDDLLARGVPGAAWFRHQARQTRKKLPAAAAEQANETRSARQTTGLSDTYALFSGGRAMSENLQLDRVLAETGAKDELVKLDSIKGITVAEMQWEELTKDLEPELDPLAEKIPFDQHAVFFPDFNALITAIDELQSHSAVVLQLAEPRGEDAGTFARYEQQLGLSLSAAARLLGPQLAKSVAMTGSDPYFRTGTDVAFLFEAVEPALLQTALLGQMATAAKKVRRAKPIQGKAGGVDYMGFRSPDRKFCSYVARLGNAIVVTNSPAQLERLAGVQQGEVKPLGSLLEYNYFRARYRRGDPEETAFLFISDATIRRWCSPRWRILTSRRTRDMAVISELQAAHMERLAEGGFRPGPVYADLPLAARGALSLSPRGVQSEAVGSLAFMTPIVEMSVDKVTKSEAEAYELWRNGYERNWTGVFDPIGLRIGLHKKTLSGDLTVMPLIGGSRYRELIRVSRGVKIGPQAGDPHDALVHYVLAINKKSPAVQRWGNFASTMMSSTKISPLGWLGESVALYFDDDPFWTELAEAPYDQRYEFFQENLGRVPVALNVEVESGLKLTAFLAGLRVFIEQAAPGMTHWESLTYKDEPYVKITPSARATRQQEEVENLAICYSASAESLIVTISEETLKRALDRRLARDKAEKKDQGAEEGDKTVETQSAWLGKSLCLKADVRAVELLSAFFADDYRLTMTKRSWANLPILNEWKRRYPDKDPVKLHQRVWKIRLIDPSGGRYVWNEQWQTMQSTAYGHPGVPKRGPDTPLTIGGIVAGDFGMTFEQQGLRARVNLMRE